MPTLKGLDRFLTFADVREAVRYSERQIRRLEDMGAFPARRQIGPRKTGWLESELTEWMRGRSKVAKRVGR